MSQKSGNLDWHSVLDCVASSDVGLRRANNQDSYAVSFAASLDDWHRQGHLLLVADGMGAHAAGELASKMAAENIVHIYRKHSEASPPEALERAVCEANLVINRRGQENLDFHNMGTTCSVLAILPQGALVAHVGDSRVYRVRGSKLHQLTFDHSLVWELRESGQFSASENAPGIPKNVITRSLGPHPVVRVDLEGPFPIEKGDTFLLCSDGLTGCVSDAELGPILANYPPEQAAQLLTDLANLRGGPDNITLVIARVIGDDIVSRHVRAEPIRIGDERKKRPPVHPAYWIVTGVLFLGALVMLMANEPYLGVVLGGLGVVAFAATLAVNFGLLRSEGVKLAGGRKLGKGPYTTTNLMPAAELATELQGFLKSAQGMAEQRQWPVDWDVWQRQLGDGNDAQAAGNAPAALAAFAEAIHALMAALHEFNQQSAS